MKLYGSLASPFVARCWLTVTAKGGGADLEMYEGGIKSDGYLAMIPIGKMPLLVDGDTAIPESGVICEYLDQVLPGPALAPTDPTALARMRLLNHITDLYLYPAAIALLRLPADGDAAAIDSAKTDALKALDYVEHFLGETKFAEGDTLTLADITLHGAVNLAKLVFGNHGVEGWLEPRPKLKTWWGNITANTTLKPAFDQIQEALDAFRKRRAEEAAKKAAAD
jgi:glutathione S-transferase